MKKSIFIVLLIVIQAQLFKAAEIISPHEIANRYLNADLVIMGKVISIKTEIIKEKETILKDGWINVEKTLIDIYTVMIDSVLKGTNIDSMIVIQSNPFPDNEHKGKFEKMNESGDSLFSVALQVSDGYRGRADLINKEGKYIILIKFENKMNISTLSMEVTKSNLKFLKKIKDKGLDAVILKPPNNKNN